MTSESLDDAINDVGELLVRMSRDLKQTGFDVHLEQDDLLGVVLRAHMLIERELTEIIQGPLPHPDRLKKPWSFAHRLELAAALGVLDEEDVPAYEYVDDLRNRAAHRLNYEFTVNEQAALIRRLPSALADAVRGHAATHPFPEPLRHALKLLVLVVAMKRHGLSPPSEDDVAPSD